MMGNVILFSLQLLISINERDHLGPRVTRTIPRSLWLRAPLFLLYSGAAGGVLFSTLVLAATLGLPALLAQLAPRFGLTIALGPAPEADMRLVTHIMTLVALYTFCYSLTAVWVRNLILRAYMPTYVNWVIALILLGVGSTVPFLILYGFFHDDYRFGARDLTWWLVANPFASIMDLNLDRRSMRMGFDAPGLQFTTVWAGLLTVLNLPWFLRQVSGFRPPAPKSA
jgi:hypothetical protein